MDMAVDATVLELLQEPTMWNGIKRLAEVEHCHINLRMSVKHRKHVVCGCQ